MIGKPITSLYPKAVSKIGDEVLRVQEISCKGSFRNISFSLRKGEILGLAGLVGSGRSEIAKSIFGIDSIDSGTIILDGEKYEPDSPAEAVIKGITLVPEDRTNEGIILEQNIQFNSTLVILDSHSKFGIVKSKVNQDLADSMITDFGIRTSGRNQMVSALSGGNQQKVVIGKWLASQPRIVILDDPTRGVDVGAKSEVYKIVAKLIESGVSVILISNDLEELVNVCDRIISLYKGEMIEEFKSRPFDSEKILSSMTLGAISAYCEE
jgi:ABC-type sugar transport system ATPase subunit